MASFSYVSSEVSIALTRALKHKREHMRLHAMTSE